MTTPTEQHRSILMDQLMEGNAGAQGYFEQRVTIYLRNGDDHGLAAFMHGFWPAYWKGVNVRRRERLNSVSA